MKEREQKSPSQNPTSTHGDFADEFSTKKSSSISRTIQKEKKIEGKYISLKITERTEFRRKKILKIIRQRVVDE